MTFRVGQKVVCVDAGDLTGQGLIWMSDAPVVGEIYTVTGLTIDHGNPCLFLAEIFNWPHTGCYNARRFRPIVERKTDISIFTAMLTPKKTRVRA